MPTWGSLDGGNSRARKPRSFEWPSRRTLIGMVSNYSFASSQWQLVFFESAVGTVEVDAVLRVRDLPRSGHAGRRARSPCTQAFHRRVSTSDFAAAAVGRMSMSLH